MSARSGGRFGDTIWKMRDEMVEQGRGRLKEFVGHYKYHLVVGLYAFLGLILMQFPVAEYEICFLWLGWPLGFWVIWETKPKDGLSD